MKVPITDIVDIFEKILDNLDPVGSLSLKDELKLCFDINIIDNGTLSWTDDDLFFDSEEDYFLFLMQWASTTTP